MIVERGRWGKDNLSIIVASEVVLKISQDGLNQGFRLRVQMGKEWRGYHNFTISYKKIVEINKYRNCSYSVWDKILSQKYM